MQRNQVFTSENLFRLILAVILVGFIAAVAVFGPGPTAYFTKNGRQVLADAGPDKTVMVGQPVLLNAGGSKAEYGQKIVRYNWRITSPLLAGAKEFSGFVYQFAPEKAGTYMAELTVITDKGAKDTDTALITVLTRGESGFLRDVYAKAANKQCKVNKECYIGWTAVTGGGSIYLKRYKINFGDGKTEEKDISGQSITTTSKHTYDTEGVYQFMITITAGVGQVDYATATINVVK